MAEAMTNVVSILDGDISSEQRKDLAQNLLGTMGTILAPPSQASSVSEPSKV